MLEKKILEIIKKIKNTKNLNKIETDLDMMKSGYLDSLEMINLVMELEKQFDFKYDEFEEKFNIISIKNIRKFISER